MRVEQIVLRLAVLLALLGASLEQTDQGGDYVTGVRGATADNSAPSPVTSLTSEDKQAAALSVPEIPAGVSTGRPAEDFRGTKEHSTTTSSDSTTASSLLSDDWQPRSPPGSVTRHARRVTFIPLNSNTARPVQTIRVRPATSAGRVTSGSSAGGPEGTEKSRQVAFLQDVYRSHLISRESADFHNGTFVGDIYKKGNPWLQRYAPFYYPQNPVPTQLNQQPDKTPPPHQVRQISIGDTVVVPPKVRYSDQVLRTVHDAKLRALPKPKEQVYPEGRKVYESKSDKSDEKGHKADKQTAEIKSGVLKSQRKQPPQKIGGLAQRPGPPYRSSSQPLPLSTKHSAGGSVSTVKPKRASPRPADSSSSQYRPRPKPSSRVPTLPNIPNQNTKPSSGLPGWTRSSPSGRIDSSSVQYSIRPTATPNQKVRPVVVYPPLSPPSQVVPRPRPLPNTFLPSIGSLPTYPIQKRPVNTPYKPPASNRIPSRNPVYPMEYSGYSRGPKPDDVISLDESYMYEKVRSTTKAPAIALSHYGAPKASDIIRPPGYTPLPPPQPPSGGTQNDAVGVTAPVSSSSPGYSSPKAADVVGGEVREGYNGIRPQGAPDGQQQSNGIGGTSQPGSDKAGAGMAYAEYMAPKPGDVIAFEPKQPFVTKHGIQRPSSPQQSQFSTDIKQPDFTQHGQKEAYQRPRPQDLVRGPATSTSLKDTDVSEDGEMEKSGRPGYMKPRDRDIVGLSKAAQIEAGQTKLPAVPVPAESTLDGGSNVAKGNSGNRAGSPGSYGAPRDADVLINDVNYQFSRPEPDGLDAEVSFSSNEDALSSDGWSSPKAKDVVAFNVRPTLIDADAANAAAGNGNKNQNVAKEYLLPDRVTSSPTDRLSQEKPTLPNSLYTEPKLPNTPSGASGYSRPKSRDVISTSGVSAYQPETSSLSGPGQLPPPGVFSRPKTTDIIGGNAPANGAGDRQYYASEDKQVQNEPENQVYVGENQQETNDRREISLGNQLNIAYKTTAAAPAASQSPAAGDHPKPTGFGPAHPQDVIETPPTLTATTPAEAVTAPIQEEYTASDETPNQQEFVALPVEYETQEQGGGRPSTDAASYNPLETQKPASEPAPVQKELSSPIEPTYSAQLTQPKPAADSLYDVDDFLKTETLAVIGAFGATHPGGAGESSSGLGDPVTLTSREVHRPSQTGYNQPSADAQSVQEEDAWSRRKASLPFREQSALLDAKFQELFTPDILPPTNYQAAPLADISRVPVPPADVSRVPVPPADVSRVPVPPADVSRAPIPPADVSRAPVPPADVSRTPLPSADVSRAPVPPADVSRTPLPSADVSRAPVPPADVSRTPVPPADVSRVPVPSADVSRAPIPPADVSRASVPPADVSRAPLPPADVSRAPLLLPKVAQQAAGKRDGDDFSLAEFGPPYAVLDPREVAKKPQDPYRAPPDPYQSRYKAPLVPYRPPYAPSYKPTGSPDLAPYQRAYTSNSAPYLPSAPHLESPLGYPTEPDFAPPFSGVGAAPSAPLAPTSGRSQQQTPPAASHRGYPESFDASFRSSFGSGVVTERQVWGAPPAREARPARLEDHWPRLDSFPL